MTRMSMRSLPLRRITPAALILLLMPQLMAVKQSLLLIPDSNLSSTQVVYVAIGATVEDASNNAINAANASFTTADIVAPTTTFSPANSATAVAVASDITLTFNEAVRLINNSALDDSNVDALITLKENNSSGADIAFNATINGGKTVITINPDSNLSSTQVVYVAIGATVEDASNNAINAANVSFTAADVSAPTMAITSAEVSDGASSNDSTLAMTFTSSEATSNFVVGDISVTAVRSRVLMLLLQRFILPPLPRRVTAQRPLMLRVEPLPIALVIITAQQRSLTGHYDATSTNPIFLNAC